MSPLDRLPGETDLQLATRVAALMPAARAPGHAATDFVAVVEITSSNGVVIEAGSPISVFDMQRLGFHAWQAAFESMIDSGEIAPIGEHIGHVEVVTGEGGAAVASGDLGDQVAELLCHGQLPPRHPLPAARPVAGAHAIPTGGAQPGPRSAMWPLRDMVADTRLALEAGEAFDRRKAAEQRERARGEAPSGPAAAAPRAPAPRDPTRPWVMP